MEVRSDDESDAGSLVDFICEDSPSESESEADDAPVSLVSSFVMQEGRRRSTRRSTAPARYVDPHFVDLMTEDATIEDVLEEADSHSEAESDYSYASETSSEPSEEPSEDNPETSEEEEDSP